MADKPMVTSALFDAKHPNTLAIYCSDGRFTDAIEEVVRTLGHARFDTLTMPGGPGLLSLRSATFSDVDSVGRASSFLIRGHGITRAVLCAHEGCGYYRMRFPGDSPAATRERQIADLREAARALRVANPQIVTLAFMAVPDGGRVRFEPVLAAK